MATKRMVVDERLPLPARKLLGIIQQVLKLPKLPATRIIQEGGVRVNGRTLRHPQATLEVGDRLEIDFDPEPPKPVEKISVSQQPLEIIYEDEAIVVVDKPPALLTVPTPMKERNTVISLLEKRLQREDRNAQAFCVHRLDRGVSGLLVFAKSLEVAMTVRDQFAARKPERKYAAIVAGHLQAEQGTFRSHLATDENLNRYSTDDEETGQLAITHFKVLKQLQEATLVEVQLETGRRNQIRVHFAEAGHPVLGDVRYGHGELSHRWPYRRLALHARTLGLAHPTSGEPLSFECPLPAEMLYFIRHSRERSDAGEKKPRGKHKRR